MTGKPGLPVYHPFPNFSTPKAGKIVLVMDSPWFYFVSTLAILLVGISKSGFGSGLGVLGVPLMALVIPPQQAAAIMLPLLCLMDIFNVWHYRRSWDGRNLVILLPAAMLGIGLGALFFRYFSDDQVRILVGSVAVIFSLNYFLRQGRPAAKTRPNAVRGAFWGAVSGFTSFGVHAGGPPLGVYLLPQQLDKTIFVGTTVLFFGVVNFVKLVPYFLLGQFGSENLLASLLLSPLAPLGIWLGIRLHRVFDERLFYRLSYTFLLVTGAKLLYDGFTALLAA